MNQLTKDYLDATALVKTLEAEVNKAAQAMLDELHEAEAPYHEHNDMSPFLFHYRPQVDWVEVTNDVWRVRYRAGYGTEVISMGIANYVEQHLTELDARLHNLRSVAEVNERRMLAKLKAKYEATGN